MIDRLKILIAYDGSETADAALADLQRAGLPADTNAIVLSVDEQWLPVPTSYWMVPTERPAAYPVSEGVTAMAARAGQAVQELFPSWEVRTESHGGSPASVILAAARKWQTDLIVIGSHGLTGLSKFVLGSVSQKILHQAPCSVRIARNRIVPIGAPIRILVGLDGSAASESAARTVAERCWPVGTEVQLLSAVATLPSANTVQLHGPLSQWFEQERTRVSKIATRLETMLRDAGFAVSASLIEGHPKSVLLQEAERQGADSIFVGSTGMSALDRLVLGSISGAVAARASCSVEVVRPNSAPRRGVLSFPA